MRLVIRPFAEPALEIDVTEPLVAAVADALGRAAGGNGVLNRLEAERLLQALFAETLVAGGASTLGAVASGGTR